jgi:hypothetical protein
LCRVAALMVRETAHFPLDPPPPLGARILPAELLRQHAERTEEAEPTIMHESPMATARAIAAAAEEAPSTEDDPILFPGTKIPRLSEWVRVQKALRGAGDPLGTLARLGIEMGTYAQLAVGWRRKLAEDTRLGELYAKQMET